MSREVRRVPPNWEHPRGPDGYYIPLFDNPYSEAARNWDLEKEQWERGFRRDHSKDEVVFIRRSRGEKYSYIEWNGERPRPEQYMPEWPESERTHYQIYETTTEGTPISPVMASPEELAHWLADNKASAFGHFTATYEGWLCTIKRGSAPSMIMSEGCLKSGVEACRKGSS